MSMPFAVLLLILLYPHQVYSTFSITAVDTVTREVGSAGASCIAGSIMLSDVFPDKGIIHTQAAYISSNQEYARTLMEQGKSPQEIVDGVVANDNNSRTRQYGIVHLTDNGTTAGFTGTGCTNYKNHTLGKNYTVQGNILLGQEILDDMEEEFLTTDGTLADKLMAALQAAKVPGADTRCERYNKSTISAFLRVAKPSDPENDIWLDLNVDNTSGSTDPIDLLQDKYDDWLATHSKQTFSIHRKGFQLFQNNPNPFSQTTHISYRFPHNSRVMLTILTPAGKVIKSLVNRHQAAGDHDITWDGTDNKERSVIGGMYLYALEVNGAMRTGKMLLVK